ncbi:molybdenum cofactor synthesis 2 [Rhodofomes roseus]|uniref:Molybdenum cofactor synthesis 2 n=1 Tax=Rhodofomes roseus TaxID=34475 RepID=A0ABQ8KI94_9APHY|nr:molybdenum cofactor synthesis 2 [Rhodofomes roseus]KAH9837206.1 molybdenum cofactor synthesis 2 [Rhodofomes roseus]
MDNPSASTDAMLQISEGVCVLTHDALCVNDIVQSVGDDRAGATAVFIGTTRNYFKGQVVTRLDYQAYSKLAIKTMADIIRAAHANHSRSSHHPEQSHVTSLIRSAVYHRLGTVPVGEPSIVIAVSSPHRKEAFAACEFILEEVKQKVQIWKREFYEGEREEDAEWKANSTV